MTALLEYFTTKIFREQSTVFKMPLYMYIAYIHMSYMMLYIRFLEQVKCFSLKCFYSKKIKIFIMARIAIIYIQEIGLHAPIMPA